MRYLLAWEVACQRCAWCINKHPPDRPTSQHRYQHQHRHHHSISMFPTSTAGKLKKCRSPAIWRLLQAAHRKGHNTQGQPSHPGTSAAVPGHTCSLRLDHHSSGIRNGAAFGVAPCSAYCSQEFLRILVSRWSPQHGHLPGKLSSICALHISQHRKPPTCHLQQIFG